MNNIVQTYIIYDLYFKLLYMLYTHEKKEVTHDLFTYWKNDNRSEFIFK